MIAAEVHLTLVVVVIARPVMIASAVYLDVAAHSTGVL